MSLDTMGACFLPYGFERQGDGTWVAFNREYFPLFTCAEMKGFSKRVEKLAEMLHYVRREKGTIHQFWLYRSPPWDSKRLFADYMNLLRRLAAVPTNSAALSLHEWTHRKPCGYSMLKWPQLERKDPPAPIIPPRSTVNPLQALMNMKGPFND